MKSKMGSKKGSTKQFYPGEVKLEVIPRKLSGDYSNAKIMEIDRIKNRTQIKTRMKWHRKGEPTAWPSLEESNTATTRS